MSFMDIAVFCSANDVSETYTSSARELAQLLGHRGHNLIYGASNSGLMKIIADGVQRGGGRIVGITIDIYHKHARPNIDEIILAKTLGERKAMMLEQADIVIVLPGGLGTLDEVTDILELKKQDRHNKEIIILDTAGFYDGLKTQLERMADEGFLQMGARKHIKAKTLDQFVQFVDTPEAAMRIIDSM